MRTDPLFGFAALYRAWRACRRGKRGTRQAQRYEIRLLDHLADTAHRLRQGLWRPSRASRFVVRHPKPREILAALFRRHAWLADVLEPLHDRNGWIVRRVDWPARVSSLASQWRYFRARYPRHSLLVQVGNRLEAWGPDAAALAHRVWGGRPVRRPGLGIGLAWPIARGRWLRGRLRRLGQPFCQIVEDGWLPGGMKRRCLEWVYYPAGPAPRATERQVESGKVHRVNEREGIMNRMKRGVWIGALAAIGWGGAPGISQAVQCQNNLPPSNPNAVYQDHGNGTVTDTRTGLMWQQCSEGQSWSPGTCSGSASGFTWSQALARAEAATFAGHADWRVPNVKELSSLVEECRINPAINHALFPNTPSSYFWSASPNADTSSFAWGVYFLHGYAYYNPRSNDGHVRLVRGGQ